MAQRSCYDQPCCVCNRCSIGLHPPRSDGPAPGSSQHRQWTPLDPGSKSQSLQRRKSSECFTVSRAEPRNGHRVSYRRTWEDQDMVNNPNSLLIQALSGQTVVSTVTLQVSTNDTPVAGGGDQKRLSCRAVLRAPTPPSHRSPQRFGWRRSRARRTLSNCNTAKPCC